MLLRSDDLVAGRYRVVRLLGRGAMAEVHLATDERLGRDVALKVLAHHLVDDDEAVRRLRREATNVAALNHPNVVTLHDVVETGDGLVLVMELVEGRTLAERIRTEGPLSVPAATAVARGVAAGLAAAHARGIVHRDVKPANVLVTSDGRVKVADFGIARATRPSATTSVMGTVASIAPEQASGAPADPRSDLYSLGCLLVEMLTGRPPFTGETPAAVLAQHLHATPPAPSDRRPEVPPAVDRLVARLLAKDPAERPGSADEVAAILHRIDDPDARAATAVVATTATATVGDVDAAAAPTTRVPAGDDDRATRPATAGTAVLSSAASPGPVPGPGPGPGPGDGTGNRRRRLAGLVAVVLAALVAVAVAAATADAPGLAPDDAVGASSPPAASPSSSASPSAPPSAAPGRAAPSPPPAASPSPTPTEPPAPRTVADGVAALRAALVAGVDEGLVSGAAADRIEDRIDTLVGKIADAAEKDDPDELADEADKRVERLREELAAQVDEGTLDPRLARRLGVAVDRLATLLGVPVGPIDDGDGGRGDGADG